MWCNSNDFLNDVLNLFKDFIFDFFIKIVCIFDDCVLVFVWIIMIFGGVYFYWLFEYISFCILNIYDNFLEVGRIYSIVIFEEKIWKVFFFWFCLF